MRLRDQVALTLPSFSLRLILGVTFLWAGTGKLMGTYPVSGESAARLANIGIIPTAPLPEANTQTDSTTDTPTESPSETPVESPTDNASEPTSQPETPTETQEDPDLSKMADSIIEKIEEAVDDAPKETPDLPTEPPNENKQINLHPVQYTSDHYAASDFPNPMEVKQVYSISLMLSRAANPGLTEDSTPIQPILPEMLGSKPWASVLAWVAAITELVAGAFLILGLLTRISALGTFSVMCVAMWLTQFGPAIVQDHNTILGFIPKSADPWSPMSYMVLLWQLGLAAMSIAVFFLGSGAIGIDRLLFKPTPRDPYIHGDPKAARHSPHQEQGDRSEFDRTPNPTP